MRNSALVMKGFFRSRYSSLLGGKSLLIERLRAEQGAGRYLMSIAQCSSSIEQCFVNVSSKLESLCVCESTWVHKGGRRETG